jgi:hypothetical protein
MMDINVNQYDKVLNYQKRYKDIKSINDLNLNENNIMKNLIIQFLHGDFIILTFENNNEKIIIFEDINYVKSNLLIGFFETKKTKNRIKFKIHLTYEKKFINLILKYLIYFENDNLDQLMYNNSTISFIFRDNFLNKMIFSLTYEELIHLQTFTDYFGINSLNKKINIVLNLIKATHESGVLINMKTPLSEYI